MDASQIKLVGLLVLVVIALRLGWLVHQRSIARKPIRGGGMSELFSFLSGLCFVAILPTILMSILVLHPEAVQLAGMTWHPLILTVVALGLGSFVFAFLHALFERGPLARALQAEASREAQGWTEEDARTSGL